jgi:hypothetical protein
MRSQRPIVYLAAAAILGICQTGLAQAKEEDSAYHWGRWAVLSPAAGGAEPYVAVKTPGAEFNARPGDASQFQPEILSVGTAPVPPGIGDIVPGDPIGNLPLPPPPPPAVPPSIGDLNPGQPIGNLPLPPPPGGI